MSEITRYPTLVFVVSFVFLWLAARIGAHFHKDLKSLDAEGREDLGIIVGATLTLLGLIIGFSFSMAISRYDQRKNLEEAEANAIGTEYVRTDLIPAASAEKVRALLKSYLDQRIAFYNSRSRNQLKEINSTTSRLQSDLWSAVREPSTSQPTPVAALVLSGMNDVLNSQGYTQAAWWNRIPIAAWGLMFAIAVCGNLLIGFYSASLKRKTLFFLILPLVVSISFYLIADIDSPRGGIIRVQPRNLVSLSDSLHSN